MAVGINKYRNAPEIIESEKVKHVCSVHAEIDALSRVNNPRGSTIYVARVGRSGNALLSRPCQNCYDAITKAGISKIVYT